MEELTHTLIFGLGLVLGALLVLGYLYDDHIPYNRHRLLGDMRMMRAAQRMHDTRRRTDQAMRSEFEPYRRGQEERLAPSGPSGTAARDIDLDGTRAERQRIHELLCQWQQQASEWSGAPVPSLGDLQRELDANPHSEPEPDVPK